MARLTWKDTDGTAQSAHLSDSCVLGRDPQVECILLYRGVSRQHARIELQEEAYYLEDLGSTNGTLLNGLSVESRIRLHNGDQIQLGKLVVLFDSERQDSRRILSTEPLSRTLNYEKALAAGVSSDRLPEVLPREAGKFYLLEKLGRGGMGDVYRATDREAGREVAVKFIRRHIGQKEAFLEFFHHREAVLAREIDHPNVIRVYEHGVEGDRHYISMEYIRGENLYRVMKRRKLEPAEILEILRQVACGLAAAHRQGVVHSDIKPANILLLGEHATSSPEEVMEETPAPEEVDPGGILEFDGDPSESSGDVQSDWKVDTGLMAEIRRRDGEKSTLEILDDPPYFRRASETRFLEHYLGRMEEKRGFFLLLEGESGVGKSRLISEFLFKQRDISKFQGDDGPRLFELDCSRIEGIPLLYEQMTSRKPGVDFNLRQIVDDLKQLVEDDPRPTVIRILDLAGASALACLLISHFVSRMEEQPLLLIASLDSGEARSNSSIKLLLDCAHAVLKELYLRPLTEYQIQRYLETLFPETPADQDLAADLYRLSGGNFSRLLDLLGSFLERGILKLDPESSVAVYRPSPREFELEEGKNLYEKYRAFGRLEQRVLECAAFMGPRFFFDVLLRLSHIEETALFFVVRQLVADGFLAEDSKTWYGFTNAAFQRYMAERIPPPERPHLHRTVSRLLHTVLVPESASLFFLRARHFAGCREYGEAVRCLLEGAHLARNGYQVDLAHEMYQEILRIYRQLARSEGPRKEVTGVLKEWFRRDGNWYEILGDLGARAPKAWVKIADFGISFRTGDEERGYQVGKRPMMGTPRYLAPERGKGEYGGPHSDLFSLGIIAYEIVVGEPPYPTLERREVVKAYQQKPLQLPRRYVESFPAGFGELIEGMLALRPAGRWDAERVILEIVKLQFDLKARGRVPGTSTG